MGCVSGWLSVDLASNSVRAATSVRAKSEFYRFSGRVLNAGVGFRVGSVIEFTKLAFPLIYIYILYRCVSKEIRQVIEMRLRREKFAPFGRDLAKITQFPSQNDGFSAPQANILRFS
jgi:hypothetical protein